MPECAECGGHVSADWARVFGVDGEVRFCPGCTPAAERAEQLGQ